MRKRTVIVISYLLIMMVILIILEYNIVYTAVNVNESFNKYIYGIVGMFFSLLFFLFGFDILFDIIYFTSVDKTSFKTIFNILLCIISTVIIVLIMLLCMNYYDTTVMLPIFIFFYIVLRTIYLIANLIKNVKKRFSKL